MITLSLCLIVKNEEDALARCLFSMKGIADEIIVVDTGSTDDTKRIAGEFTDQIYDFQWCDDFAKARNYSFSKASMDYIMWLDADDIISPQSQQMLLELKQTLPPQIDMVMLKYDVAFDEKGNATFTYYRERIFKRCVNYQWVGEIHEVIAPKGNIIYQDIAVKHNKQTANEPERNLRIFRKMLEDGKAMEPRQQYYYGRELFYNGHLDEAIDQFTQFLKEGKGWIENSIGACKDLALCYYAKNKPEQALESLLKSLTFDRPRAEICCDIGKHFFDRQQYQPAIFWYETATSCQMDEKSGAFCQPDYYGYIPFMQLCVCYDRMGYREKAIESNDKAGEFKPEDARYLYNKKYFA